MINSPQERIIHHIAVPTPSVHAPLPADSYNLFATAATDNVISLWDLRAPSCAARYSGHVNRCVAVFISVSFVHILIQRLCRREDVRCSFSPCLRYLGIGSEDRYGRIVDVHSGQELAKLQPLPQHKDVVTDVCFNPLFAQVATCSYDGVVKFYADPTRYPGT